MILHIPIDQCVSPTCAQCFNVHCCKFNSHNFWCESLRYPSQHVQTIFTEMIKSSTGQYLSQSQFSCQFQLFRDHSVYDLSYWETTFYCSGVSHCLNPYSKWSMLSWKVIHQMLNSLWPSNAIRWQRSGSTLAQVMAWWLTAPSHYMNQCKQQFQPIYISLHLYTLGLPN